MKPTDGINVLWQFGRSNRLGCLLVTADDGKVTGWHPGPADVRYFLNFESMHKNSYYSFRAVFEVTMSKKGMHESNKEK